MKKTLLALAVTLSPALLAQNVGNFSGPSILSQGANTIGQRSGEDVDLRVYANAAGIYDTGLVPYEVKNGSLVKPDPLWGVEAGLGAYGRHSFRRSVLGLDYTGNFRHYTRASNYDGANQSLRLGYTWQKSRRLLVDMTGTASTQTYGTVVPGGSDSLATGNSLLFDNRTNYLQGGMNVSYSLSNRTSVTMGGSGYTVRRKAAGLAGVNGYTLNGSVHRQFTRNLILGASYQHTHYDFPKAFGESDLNGYSAIFSYQFLRTWKLDLTAGVYTSEVQGVQSTALDPTIAALLGVGSVQTIFYRTNILPSGTASLSKTFRKSSFTASYVRTVMPGNGFFLTSRQESYGGGYSYSGIRRWTLSLNASSSDLRALGQQLQRYRYLTAGATVNYRLGADVNVYASYMRRQQDLASTFFQRDSSRVSIGIAFQPGNIPLSFR